MRQLHSCRNPHGVLQLDNCFNQSVSSLRKLVGCIDMIDSVDRGTVSNGVGGTGARPPTESLEPLQAYAKRAEELLGNETSLHVGAGQSLQTAEARTCGAQWSGTLSSCPGPTLKLHIRCRRIRAVGHVPALRMHARVLLFCVTKRLTSAYNDCRQRLRCGLHWISSSSPAAPLRNRGGVSKARGG